MAAHLRRTCICCRSEAPKGELLRFVRQQGRVVFDAQHRLQGRGAYVHPRFACWRKMGEAKRWRYAFPVRSGEAGAPGAGGELEKLMEEVRALIRSDEGIGQFERAPRRRVKPGKG